MRSKLTTVMGELKVCKGEYTMLALLGEYLGYFTTYLITLSDLTS